MDYVRGAPGDAIRAEVEGEPVYRNISTAVPCSLIVNELVTTP